MHSRTREQGLAYQRFIRLSILLLILVAVVVAWQWHHFLRQPVVAKGHADVVYLFKKGATAQTLAQDLTAMGLIQQPRFLRFLAYLNGDARYLQAGEYRFKSGDTPRDILKTLRSGEGVQREFTIVEGVHLGVLLKRLKKNEYVQHTLSGSPKTAATEIGINRESLEGMLLPETYHFSRGMTDVELLRWAHRMLQEELQRQWALRDPGVPYSSPYQALVAASLIEKETAVEGEKGLIAGVIANRLRQKMRLQIDASVVYGLKKFKRSLTKLDLRADTPYNTYKRTGLPPTPIAMPSRSSIYAALHPIDTDILYFVAKGDGRHVFASSLKKHNDNVRRYILKKQHGVTG